MVRAGGRIVSGEDMLKALVDGFHRDDMAAVQQEISARIGRGPLLARFARWNRATLDLPGTYYLEVTERIFRQNQIANRRFCRAGPAMIWRRCGCRSSCWPGRTTCRSARSGVCHRGAFGYAAGFAARACEPSNHLGLSWGTTPRPCLAPDRTLASSRHRRCRGPKRSARKPTNEKPPDCACNPGRGFSCSGRRYFAAVTMISTLYFGAASLASTVARAGYCPPTPSRPTPRSSPRMSSCR